VEAKDEVEMQTPVDDSSIFAKVSRSIQVSPLVLLGNPRKGQAPDQVTPWIASDFPHMQVGLRYAFRQASPEPLLSIFIIKLSAKTPQALFPPVHGGGHTTNMVGVVS
jgi:hypothetical protein